jgi:hypothetical protein
MTTEVSRSGGPVEPADVTPAMQLQILSTEHWSLLASRSLAWTEAFARTSMFLSTLSFATVALALVAQATGFGESFRLFALAILPIVLALGISTLLRLESSNYHDALCVVGMNRIRARYVEMAPGLRPLFVMGLTDDFEGITRTMATNPAHTAGLALFAASPVQVAILNAVLGAVIVGLAAAQLGAATGVALTGGVITFVLGCLLFAWHTRRTLRRAVADHRPMYPGQRATGT